MDYSESTKVVFQRIEKLDPENVSKIIGYLLLKGHGELEMIRLAFGPDNVIQSLIDQVKKEIDLSPKPAVSAYNSQAKHPSSASTLPTNFTPFTPARRSWSTTTAPVPPDNSQLVQNCQYIYPVAFVEPPPAVGGGYVVPNQPPMVLVDDQMRSCNVARNYCAPLPSLPEMCPHFPEHICESFNQGYCKHGGNCRFLHLLKMKNGRFMVLNPPKTEQDYILSNGSLKQLEIELIGILRTRRGIPVSISSLPILYYDKYGNVLQVEGYLMEVPGQGKLSFNLTQLIAQMTKGIRLIDRPHGRQSIILVEDIPKYMRFIEERCENESGSCQVYLTFPPQSMFTEEDVYAYFNYYGPVQEVRLPNQERRMFGFVTFVFPETAALVLTKTNPHFICGAKILVKPYRLKPVLVERKSEEKVQLPIHIDPHLADAESKLPSIPKTSDAMMFFKKQLSEGHEKSVELEKKERGVGFSLTCNHLLVGQTSNGSDLPEGAWRDCCSSEDKVYHNDTCNNNQESSGEVNLPESLFGFEVANGVSPLM